MRKEIGIVLLTLLTAITLGEGKSAKYATQTMVTGTQKADFGQKLNSHEIEEGYINVTGGKVWYRIVGIKQTGTPLIAVHGGPGYPSDYLEPIEGLADERPVIFYDQIGCGRSDLTNDSTLWTLERYVLELDQVRQALNLNKVHLLGQSWGSMLVTEYYLTHMQSGVVSLISSGSFHSVPRFEADQQIHIANLPPELQRIIHRNEANGTTASAEYQFAKQVFYNRHLCRSDPWPNNIKRSSATLGGPYFYMWGPSEFYCTGTLKGYDHTSRFKEIAIPMLFTCGQYDECRPETVQWYQSLVPGAEVKIFKNAAHQHHVEAADQYLTVVRDFLKRAEARHSK